MAKIKEGIYRHGGAIQWSNTFAEANEILEDLYSWYRSAPYVIFYAIYGSGKSTALEYLHERYSKSGLVVIEGDILLTMAIGCVKGVSPQMRLDRFARSDTPIFELEDADKEQAVKDYLKEMKMSFYPIHITTAFPNAHAGRQENDLVAAILVARYTFWKENLRRRIEAMHKDGFPAHKLRKQRVLTEKEFYEDLLTKFKTKNDKMKNFYPVLNFGDDDVFTAGLDAIVRDYFPQFY
jgi:hypothetical protein